MKRIFSQSLFVLAVLAIVSTTASGPVFGADHRESPLIGGLVQGQFYRVCIAVVPGTPQGQGGGFDTEIVSMDLVGTIPGEGVASFLTQELSVPSGEFRCFDFSYARLAEALRLAGGEPDPTTGALTFAAELHRESRSANVISATVMNINAMDGKIELHATIGLRTPIVDGGS